MGYGEWKSPITLDAVTADCSVINSAAVDPDSGKLFWDIKTKSGENHICTWEEGKVCVWTPNGFSATSRVHEYGGGAYFIYKDHIYFVNKSDQRLYRQDKPQSAPNPITEDTGKGLLRYACGHINTFTNHIIMVREDHRVEGAECVNTIVSINPETGKQNILCSGADFYRGIVTHEDKIMFVSWNHPNMPWDVTSLYTGKLVKTSDGGVSVENLECIETDCSLLQPQIVNHSDYFYLSDRAGYYNVWKSGVKEKPFFESKGESGYPFGWIFGFPGYGLHGDELVVSVKDKLLVIDANNPQTVNKDLTEITLKHGYKFNDFAHVMVHGDTVYFLGISDAAHNTTLIKISLLDNSLFAYNNSSAPENLIPYISYPQLITFPTSENSEAVGYLYLPKNPDFIPNDDEKPPLIVHIHGGPTGFSNSSLCMKIQYFTSRGFAYFDINYRGSTGYGRAYRQLLYGKWGIYDLDDAVNGAQYLVKEGQVDGNRLCITGGSAGGYTCMAVQTFQKTFQAAVAYYGVSDLLELAKCTHKFESRYLDQMIGKLPDDEAIYKERSPINHSDKLTGGLGILQGLDDFVVPPPQSEAMYQAACDKKVPTFIVEYEGEGHGFKKEANIQHSITCEIYFYSKIFGFKLADETKNPPEIKNL